MGNLGRLSKTRVAMRRHFALMLKSMVFTSPAFNVNLLESAAGAGNFLVASCQPMNVSSTPAGTFLIVNSPFAFVRAAYGWSNVSAKPVIQGWTLQFMDNSRFST